MFLFWIGIRPWPGIRLHLLPEQVEVGPVDFEVARQRLHELALEVFARRELGDQRPHLLGIDLVLGAVQAMELAGLLGHAQALQEFVDTPVIDAAHRLDRVQERKAPGDIGVPHATDTVVEVGLLQRMQRREIDAQRNVEVGHQVGQQRGVRALRRLRPGLAVEVAVEHRGVLDVFEAEGQLRQEAVEVVGTDPMVFQEEAHVLDRRRALEQVDRHGMAHPAARLDLGVDLLAELLHRDGAETGRLGSETILDQVDLARHPAAGRLRMRIAAYVQFRSNAWYCA